jgi:hypothetical protein
MQSPEGLNLNSPDNVGGLNQRSILRVTRTSRSGDEDLTRNARTDYQRASLLKCMIDDYNPSGAKGNEYNFLPVALAMAFLIAGAIPRIGVSPAP